MPGFIVTQQGPVRQARFGIAALFSIMNIIPRKQASSLPATQQTSKQATKPTQTTQRQTAPNQPKSKQAKPANRANHETESESGLRKLVDLPPAEQKRRGNELLSLLSEPWVRSRAKDIRPWTKTP